LRGELAGAELSEVNLRGADLRWTNLNDGYMAQNQATVAIKKNAYAFLTDS
jgi:uncharacterized protein YjbI with pentapeptide repeats